MDLPSGSKRYGTGIGTGVGMAVMFSPQPTDPPMVIVAKLILIAAPPIASIIADAIEKYAKAKYAAPNAAAQVAAAVTAVIPPAEPPKV